MYSALPANVNKIPTLCTRKYHMSVDKRYSHYYSYYAVYTLFTIYGGPTGLNANTPQTWRLV